MTGIAGAMLDGGATFAGLLAACGSGPSDGRGRRHRHHGHRLQ